MTQLLRSFDVRIKCGKRGIRDRISRLIFFRFFRTFSSTTKCHATRMVELFPHNPLFPHAGENNMNMLDDYLNEIEDSNFVRQLSQSETKQAKIKELQSLIKSVSDSHGGDDPMFLDEYIQEVISNNDIDKALACFRGLAKQKP